MKRLAAEYFREHEPLPGVERVRDDQKGERHEHCK